MTKKKSGGKFTKVLIVIIIIVVAVAAIIFWYQSKNAVKVGTLEKKLQNSSELTTQKLIYTDVKEESSGKIPIISKDKYLMKYKATIDAGFDIKDTDIEVGKSTVTVTIPHAKIQSVNIDPNDIDIYDTSISLKRTSKKQLIEAQRAIKDAKKSAAKDPDFLPCADENSEDIIKGILEGSVGDKEINVEFK